MVGFVTAATVVLCDVRTRVVVFCCWLYLMVVSMNKSCCVCCSINYCRCFN